MDPVNSIGQIVQILRRKLADRTTPQVAGGTASKTSEPAPAQKVSAEEIRRKIGARIRALSAEERRGPKAAQVFIESIIAWEFGDEVLQDSKLAELSSDILNTIAADGEASARLKTLLSEL